MFFHRKVLTAIAFLCVAMVIVPTAAFAKHDKNKPQVKKIVFVPHDNRPVSEKQSVEVVKKLGYEVAVPPDHMLGSRESLGNPDEVWDWMEENAKDAEAAVISSDTMLYGSLVGSRKHEYSMEKVLQRAERFCAFRKEHPEMKLYVFGSIMRTPRSGEASGHMEPEYYMSYGADIFRYSALTDKAETGKLTYREQKELGFLKRLIPSDALNDWLERRNHNLAANKYLINLTKKNVFDYFVLGRDDNAPLSQTHMESRRLEIAAKGLNSSHYQSMAGIDEIGMLLLCRAVNVKENRTPFVYVRYNIGRGENTIPAYSDEKIGSSIKGAIAVAGAAQIYYPEKADMILMVNTNRSGRTFEAADFQNRARSDTSTAYFVDQISKFISQNYPVVLADISYANGSDNALMEELRKRELLFKLRAYAGWNTATNSTGFVIGAGLLTRNMKQEDMEQLLLVRYLDDWAYQANIRNTLARQLTWVSGDGVYGRLDAKREALGFRAWRMMERFVKENISVPEGIEVTGVDFPWNRMFESDVLYRLGPEKPWFQ